MIKLETETEMENELRELIKRWATVDYLIDHWGEGEDEYFSDLVCEEHELTQKIRKLYNQLRRCERQPECSGHAQDVWN